MELLRFVPQILFFLAVWGIIRLLRKYEDPIFDFYFNRIKWQTEITKDEFYRYAKYLSESSSYFRNLSHDGKAKFVHRVKHVMATKEFEGRQGLHLTERMVVLVSGAIVQVTFGLDRFELSHFTTIRLFPEPFYFRLYEKYLKGGTSKSGVIFLSWADFEEGYSDDYDKYNLGLHEVAHALKLNVTEGDRFDLKFASYLDIWMDISQQEFSRMQEVGEGFLREYASGNMHEFFAVCVEHFFEASEDFKRQLPDIYNHLCVLLNQEPTNPNHDYALPRDFAHSVNKNRALIPVPEKISLSFAYVSSHWAFTITALGFTILWPISLYLASDTIMTTNDFLIITGVFALIGIEQWFWFREKSVMSLKFFPFYLIGGFCSIMLCIFLYLNSNVSFGTSVETYDIEYYRVEHHIEYVVTLSEDKLAEYPDMRTFSEAGFFYYTDEPTKVEFNFSNGIMGYRTLNYKRAY